MATSAHRNDRHAITDERAARVRFSEFYLIVELRDGREISTPITWYPTLRSATEEQRSHWRLIGEGIGIHWPDIDEDLSIEGMLAGRPAFGWDR